jgi:hypothetical protein
MGGGSMSVMTSVTPGTFLAISTISFSSSVSARMPEIFKRLVGFRRGLGVNAARGVGNEQRRRVVANAGRVDYQVVEQRVVPIDIKQRTQPPAAHSVQFF